MIRRRISKDVKAQGWTARKAPQTDTSFEGLFIAYWKTFDGHMARLE